MGLVEREAKKAGNLFFLGEHAPGGEAGMPVRATIGLGTCLIALDASVCFSVNALLPQVAAEFGFGESHAAMLLSTPFYAGRLLAYLVAPMLVPLTSAQYVVGASSLALALSVAWLANGRSLVECGVARFACGVASGPALRAVLALVGRRRPSQAAPFFHLLQSAAVFGALFAQTPLLELARVVGWRRALIASHSLPAAFVSLLVAWTSGRGGGEGQRRLLGSSSHRLHISRAGSASSATMLDGARSWSSPLVDQHDGGADCQGCSGRGDDWLALLREPHLLLFAAAASCLQAAVDQLGGPLGLLALRNGYRRNAHGARRAGRASVCARARRIFAASVRRAWPALRAALATHRSPPVHARHLKNRAAEKTNLALSQFGQ